MRVAQYCCLATGIAVAASLIFTVDYVKQPFVRAAIVGGGLVFFANGLFEAICSEDPLRERVRLRNWVWWLGGTVVGATSNIGAYAFAGDSLTTRVLNAVGIALGIAVTRISLCPRRQSYLRFDSNLVLPVNDPPLGPSSVGAA